MAETMMILFKIIFFVKSTFFLVKSTFLRQINFCFDAAEQNSAFGAKTESRRKNVNKRNSVLQILGQNVIPMISKFEFSPNVKGTISLLGIL